MLSFTDMIRDEIPPTKTYHLREVLFIPADDRQRGNDGLGRLTLKLQHRRGYNRAFDLDSYILSRDEQPEPNDNGGKAYWVHNITDDREAIYRCVVGGLTPRCNCKASQCNIKDEAGELVCKHYSAIKHLTEMGVI